MIESQAKQASLGSGCILAQMKRFFYGCFSEASVKALATAQSKSVVAI